MLHTSQSLSKQDGDFENYHYQLEDRERYQLTEGEIEWMQFIKGKYCIVDHLQENMDENNIYTIDLIGLSEAILNDGISYKAVMLSDDSTLQSIIFYSNLND